MLKQARRRRWVALGVLVAAAAAIALLLLRDAGEQPLVLQTSAVGSAGGDVPRIERTSERAYDGEGSIRAHTQANAPQVNKYARAARHNLGWGVGTDVWYGAAFYLPDGFYEAQQGQIDLMRWDNFVIDATSTDRGGIVIYGGSEAGNTYLIRAQLGGDQDELIGPFRISEGTWHWIEVRQRFSSRSGSDLSEVYLDGDLVGRSTAANWYGRPVTSIRYGLVAVGGAQAKSLDLWFDRPSISAMSTGPLER